MKTLLLRELNYKRLSNTLFVIAIFLVLTILPLLLNSLQTLQSQVEKDISYYSRGSYDLLIRPEGQLLELEEELGIVPENYLGFGEGGISIEQWEEIKAREDVEIAAPVASLGYFTGITTNISFMQPEESSRYEVQYQTSDNINVYPVGDPLICLLLESPQTIESQNFEEIMADPSLLSYCTNDFAQFPSPPTYHLVVGIDPEQEEALTGISFENIDEERTSAGWGSTYIREHEDASLIPIMEAKESVNTLNADVSIATLPITAEDTAGYREHIGLLTDTEEMIEDGVNYLFFQQKLETSEYKALFQELSSMEASETTELSVNIGSELHSFVEPEFIILDNDGNIFSDEEFLPGMFKEISLNHSSIYYLAGFPNYEYVGDQLRIRKLDHEDNLPTYREVVKYGETLYEAVEHNRSASIVVDPVGVFEIGEREEMLASSPLGIYRQAPVTYVGEGENHGVEILPTITPGSFVTPHASGVTNISAASVIKGDVPIDAIRVKVAGITDYSREAARKIDSIAEEIEDMGLHVTIIAGSSPQSIVVDVEGIGLVEESWTTLGAAGDIINMWNLSTIVIAMLFIFTVILYTFNRFFFWSVMRKQEILLFENLGWKRKDIKRLYRLNITILTIAAYLFSTLAIVIYDSVIGITGNIWSVYLWQVAVILILVLFTMSMIGRNIDSVFPNKTFNQHQVQTSKAHTSFSPVFKSIVYYRKYISLPFVQLLMISIVTSYVYLSLTETVMETNITILGQYINNQISTLQIFIVIVTYILAAFTVGESTSTLLTARKTEIDMFKVVGWDFMRIFLFYTKETVLWSTVAIFLGNLVILGLFSLMFEINQLVLVTVIVSLITTYLFTLIINSINLSFFLRGN